VHQFPDISATPPHEREPLPGDGAQLDRLIIQPALDSRIALCAFREPKDLDAVGQTADVQRNTGTSGHLAMIPPLAAG
jgi:hypothetical protein